MEVGEGVVVLELVIIVSVWGGPIVGQIVSWFVRNVELMSRKKTDDVPDIFAMMRRVWLCCEDGMDTLEARTANGELKSEVSQVLGPKGRSLNL